MLLDHTNFYPCQPLKRLPPLLGCKTAQASTPFGCCAMMGIRATAVCCFGLARTELAHNAVGELL